MELLHAIILGIVEGITEFLPISSTGHLTIVEQLLGYQIDSPAITAFTALVQIGAIMAAVVYFWRDIVRIAVGWCRGVVKASARSTIEYRMGWYVIIGSVPIVVVGVLAKDIIETSLRGLWLVAGGLLLWSVVLYIADRVGSETKQEADMTWRDALVMGLVQCLALVPGVSRSGATIAAGLLRGIDRVTATRMSFFLGIPVLLAAGAVEALSQGTQISMYVGWTPMIAGIITSFIVGYISIAWLLKFVSHHNFTPFVIYRVGLAVILIALLTAGVL